MTGIFLPQQDKQIAAAPASALSADWALPSGGTFPVRPSSKQLIPMRRTRLDIVDGIIATVDVGAGGQADGVGLKLGSFPEGHIAIFAAISNFNIVTAAGVSAAGVVWSLGTVIGASGDAALTSTEADIIPSTTLGDGTVAAATAEVENTLVGANANKDGIKLLDGSTTAKDMFLNIAGTFTKASGSTSTFTINKNTGQPCPYVDLFWAFLGDD